MNTAALRRISPQRQVMAAVTNSPSAIVNIRKPVACRSLNMAVHAIIGNKQKTGRRQHFTSNSSLDTIGFLSHPSVNSRTQEMLMRAPAIVPQATPIAPKASAPAMLNARLPTPSATAPEIP